MRHPTIVPLPAAAEYQPSLTLAPRLAPITARRILGGAAACGIAADLLFANSAYGAGITLFLWVVAFAIGGFSMDAIRALPLRVRALLGASVACASLLLFRDSEVLAFFNTVAALFFMLLAAAFAKPGSTLSLTTARVRDLLGILPAGVADTASGAPRFLFSDARAAFLGTDGTSRSGTAVAVARATAIAAFLTAGFALLLSGGDPVFRSLVAWPASWNALAIPEHVFRFGFFAWPVMGLMWGSTRAGRLPVDEIVQNGITLNRLDVVTALGAMNALFAAYLLLQVRVLFGGSAYVLQTTGLTLAQYARDGFFALAFAAWLVLSVLLVLNALLKEDRLGAWHVSRRLSTSLLVMVGLMLASAATRMLLYVSSFGITVDRIVALAAMACLAIVSCWFWLTVLRERAHRFVIGFVSAAGATLLALNVINPEAIAARSTLARVERGGEFDQWYASNLGSDATPVLVEGLREGRIPRTPAAKPPMAPVVASQGAVATVAPKAPKAPNCIVAEALLQKYGSRDARWTATWTASGARARRTVQQNRALLDAQCEKP